MQAEQDFLQAEKKKFENSVARCASIWNIIGSTLLHATQIVRLSAMLSY